MLRVLGIGLACVIGARLGRRLAMLFGYCLAVTTLLTIPTTPLRAQLIYGDSTMQGIFIYVDTLSPWQHKLDSSRPWVQEYKPPVWYETLWFRTAECQRLKTSRKAYKSYKWMAVNLESFGNRNLFEPTYIGYTMASSRTIFVALPQRFNLILLTHEISHALMHDSGEPSGHPAKRFGPSGCGFSYGGVDS